VTEVPWAQGRNALPPAVRPEEKWAMLRHHAGVGGLACRLGTRDAIGLRNAVNENGEVSRRLARHTVARSEASTRTPHSWTGAWRSVASGRRVAWLAGQQTLVRRLSG
jgi:hypothetical protein